MKPGRQATRGLFCAMTVAIGKWNIQQIISRRNCSTSLWMPIKLDADLSSIAMNDNHMWVTGGNGIVLHYDGSQWNRVSAPITTTLNSVAALSGGKAWIAGDNGVILRCTVSECMQEASPTSFDLFDIAITEGGKSGWVVGRNNCILRYDGRHWSKIFDWEKMARAQ